MKIGYAQDVITPSLDKPVFSRALATTAALTGYEAMNNYELFQPQSSHWLDKAIFRAG